MSTQPALFETEVSELETEKLSLYALGEFQSRGLLLAERELALDRLLGAFKRASEKFGVVELSDKQIAESLEKLGARITEVPNFVAKHPFRVTIPQNLSSESKEFYERSFEDDRN